jgi:cadmium resistance protein CadD (predicted permease)
VRFDALIFGIMQFVQLRAAATAATISGAAKPHLHRSITLSIAADNVGVYIVFFKINRTNLWRIIAIELVLSALWCATASWFGRPQVIPRLVDRMGRIVAPLVFIGLSLYLWVRRPPSVAPATASREGPYKSASRLPGTGRP